jgi:oligopeptidase B
MKNTKIPIAQRINHKIFIHDQELVDQYHWLRDQNWPNIKSQSILEYLKAENNYTESYFKPLNILTDKLYNEMLGRIELSDKSVPIKHSDGYYYFTITEEKLSYPIYARQIKDGLDEIILDQNKEAEGYNFFNIGSISVSPNGKLLAFSQDTTGDEHFTILVKDLSENKLLSESITNVIGDIEWNKIGSGFYYTKLDDKWRANKVYFHRLGDTQEQDQLILEELDPIFRLDISKSSSEEYIFITSSSSTSTEVSFIKAENSSDDACVIIQRREDHLYEVDHINGNFYIYTNDKGKNFRLVKIAVDKYLTRDFIELVPHSDDKYLTDFYLYTEKLVIVTKELGLPKIAILNYDLSDKKVISFSDQSYTASVIYSCVSDNGILISYSSLNSPHTIFKYIFAFKDLVSVKTQKIPIGYDKDLYQSERLFAISKDGVNIPISLVYKKSLFKKDGSNPLFLYGYGSYGIAIPPAFNTNVISLLNEGFIYAIAHVRGGDDLGFKWYESAKFLNKKRTFEDFISVADYLIENLYTKQGEIAIMGGSAGGMLVSVVMNERPELFKIVIADVPFNDVLNTMLDDTLPLTPGEFKEWGNPKEKEYFDYIKSYSPYDNIRQQNYPTLYVLAGLNDPRVTYWEPAKFVAKLRATKTDNNTLLLETEMEAGHRGKSGRFDRLKEIAKKYAFILHEFAINK